MPLPSLLDDYNKYASIDKDPNQEYIDLSSIRFIAPTSLLPAYHFGECNSITSYLPHYNTREHLSKIFGLSQGNRNLLPLVPINLNQDNKIKVRILSGINEKIREVLFNNNIETYLDYGDEGFKYIIDEVLSNVDQHSNADKMYVYCQNYPNENYVDVGILDDGDTIPGKYEYSQDEFKDKEINPYLFKNDCDALYKSINGISTKREFKLDIEDLNHKNKVYNVDTIGHGINTSVRAITDVFGGSMLIASRGGVCHLTPYEKTFIKAEEHNIINGTLMCIRFKKCEFNLKEYRNCILKHRMIKDVNM